MSSDNLVAQTYDGTSNMSGRYNGLQAKLKEFAGEEHIILVHCYADTLNLVLGDTASASLDVAKLFENLQALYVMASNLSLFINFLKTVKRKLNFKYDH